MNLACRDARPRRAPHVRSHTSSHLRVNLPTGQTGLNRRQACRVSLSDEKFHRRHSIWLLVCSCLCSSVNARLRCSFQGYISLDLATRSDLHCKHQIEQRILLQQITPSAAARSRDCCLYRNSSLTDSALLCLSSATRHPLTAIEMLSLGAGK